MCYVLRVQYITIIQFYNTTVCGDGLGLLKVSHIWTNKLTVYHTSLYHIWSG